MTAAPQNLIDDLLTPGFWAPQAVAELPGQVLALIWGT